MNIIEQIEAIHSYRTDSGYTVVRLGKEYYSVYPEMLEWMNENFGPGGKNDKGHVISHDTWSVMSVFGNTFYTFVKAEDATLFVLRWVK